MNHLDEGTIHAWLDGALDAAQSREIEAHVAGCPACSASVAEARGLIAGASRILAALDDVPAGVIPGAAPAAPGTLERDGVTPIAARRDIRRGWRITSWASGIAAVLVGAIVLSTASKVDRPSEFSQTRVLRADSAGIGLDRVAGDVTAPERASAPELRAPSVGTSAPARGMAVRGESAVQREVAPSAPPAAMPAPGGSEQALAGRLAGGAATRSTTANQARTVAPSVSEPMRAADVPPTTEAAAAQTRQLAASAVQLDTSRIRTTAQRDTTRLRTSSDARLESVVVTGLGAARDSVGQQFAGCYRIDAPRAASAEVAKAAGAQRRAADRAAPSAAAAPQPTDFSARGLPPLVRLDTARAGLGYLVRLPADSAIGSWRVVGDSVLIDLGSRGSVKVSARQRVGCPEPR